MGTNKNTAGTGLTFTRLASVLPWPCPHCQYSDSPLEFTDGDTLDVEIEQPEDYSLYPGYMKGTCGNCGSRVYFLEISRLSGALDGYYFANDNCFKAEQSTNYLISNNEMSWTACHHVSVTGAFFTACDPDAEEDSLTSNKQFAFLDVHTIGPDAFKDASSFFERARSLFRLLRSDILSLKLPATDENP